MQQSKVTRIERRHSITIFEENQFVTVNMSIPRQKPHRLEQSIYLHQTVALTLCLKSRDPFFVTADRFEISKQHLTRSLAETDCQAGFYVFMPDHAHFLITGHGDDFSALQAAAKFKQFNGFWMSRQFGQSLWQKTFFDHITRNDADRVKHLQYMMLNPVRRSLTEQWNAYPF